MLKLFSMMDDVQLDDGEVQLTGNDEAIFHDERRTAEDDYEAHNSSPINSYKTPKWSLGTSHTW